ncbi:hypothetical protein Tco_0663975 [Tanacetum coccineum]
MLTFGGQGTSTHVLLSMRALYSSRIACFQLGSRREWKGDLGIGGGVGGGGGGGGGVVGGVGVVCGDGVNRGVGGVVCGFVSGVKAPISAMIIRVPEKDRWCGTRGKFVRGKRCEKNYSSVRRYVADPDNAYPKRSITKLILKGAVIFDVVSYQFRCALNYSKLLLKLLNQEYVARIRGKLIQKLLLNQKCMGYLVRAYYSISPTKYYKDDSCWSADLKSNTTEDVISI